MVKDLLSKNASVIGQEILWFSEVIDTRMKLYFKKDCEYKTVFDITPPLHLETDTPYVQFIHHYQMTQAERIVLMLALAPHVCPQVLDVFWTKNGNTERGFTEFGGLNGSTHGGFLPNAETALFLLAGNTAER